MPRYGWWARISAMAHWAYSEMRGSGDSEMGRQSDKETGQNAPALFLSLSHCLMV